MSFSEYAKAFAGRWAPRSSVDLTPLLPEPEPAVTVAVGDLQPYSTPRAACTLMRGEQVWVTGSWRTIGRVECLRSSQGPAQTLLHLSDGSILGSRFDFEYVSRDEDEQAAAGVSYL